MARAKKHPETDPEGEFNELITARHHLLRKLGKLQRKIDRLETLVDERAEAEYAVMRLEESWKAYS